MSCDHRTCMIPIGHVARLDITTDGKEHVWSDVWFTGVVILDDVGNDW